MRRGLARSRGQARDLIGEGRVRVAGVPRPKPATEVDPSSELLIEGPVSPWVNRAAGKLEAALDHWGIAPHGRRALDVGASTGGFTEVLLARGARHVVALDVGHRPDHVESSLPYAAPELLLGRNPAAAADEYALACTAIELLTGSTPFVAATAMGLVEAHLYSPVPGYSHHIDAIPHAFDSIIAKAMAKDPDNRYPTCTEFIALVTHVLLDGR